MILNPAIAQRLTHKLKKLNNLRPLPSSTVQKLREQFEIEMTYNSNAIEGNSLSLRETFLVLHEGITVKNKPLKDHLEATNHKEALDFLYELIEHEKQVTISEYLIKNLHQLITQQIEKEWAGQYRNASVRITGTDHQPPDALDLPHEIDNLISWFSKNNKKMHPVELAAVLHHKFVHIHPFFDGNGRTGRLLMNVALMQYGYPLAIILKNDRKKYYRSLQEADKNNCLPLVNFVAKAVERSLDIYLDILTPSKEKKEHYLSLLEAAKGTQYSAKYLNLLINQGKLEGVKRRRNWITTKEAIERYRANRQRKRK